MTHNNSKSHLTVMKRLIIVPIFLAMVAGFWGCAGESNADQAMEDANDKGTEMAAGDVNATTQPATDTQPTQPQANDDFQWEVMEHNFGKVKQGNPAKYRFKFTNASDAPLTVKNVKPSCGCTAADYTKGEIAPGAEGFVEAEYDAKKPGVFNKTVTVFPEEGPAVQLRLRGEVEADPNAPAQPAAKPQPKPVDGTGAAEVK